MEYLVYLRRSLKRRPARHLTILVIMTCALVLPLLFSIYRADEPTGNLDRKMADEIIHLLLELNGKGITILLVTHEERYADMCGRKLVISDGRIVN